MTGQEWLESGNHYDTPFMTELCDCSHRRDRHHAKGLNNNRLCWGGSKEALEAECGAGDCIECDCKGWHNLCTFIDQVRLLNS